MSTATEDRTPPPAPASFLDVEALLAPIPGASAAGGSLRYEGTYDAIREARQEDDPTLPQGVWEHAPRRAEWRRVAQLAAEALAGRSKDLQIAAWLVEACLKLEGVGALGPGLDLLAGLCERYWEGLHPEMPGGDSEYRSAVLEWVGQRFAAVLRMDPVSLSVESLERPLTLADWERARWLTQHPGAGAAGQVGPDSPQAFLALTATTEAAFYHRRHRALVRARAPLRRLEALIDERFPVRDAPSLKPLRESLEALAGLVSRILEARGEVPAATVPPGEEDAGEGGAKAADGEAVTARAAPAPAPAGGAIASREDAYRRLREAADYLLRTEPHSPTPYLVLRAVAWGDRSLLEVLEELLPDAQGLDQLRGILGLGGPGDGSTADRGRR